jgi:hypothetical protein
MKKATLVLGTISLTLTTFLLAIYVQFLVQSSGSNDGWADLGLFLMMFFFTAVMIILSIPFLIIGLKLKFKDMTFYLISHLAYVLTSITLFIVSIL